MKQALLILFVAAAAMAEAPADLGNFEGTLFTGASLRQALSLKGGTFSQCEVDASTSTEIHKCAVEGASIEVAVPGSGTEQYSLQRVVVLKRATQTSHHYYRGVRTIRVGTKNVSQPVSVTITLDPKDKTHISGYLELSHLEVRSGIEAYRAE